MRRIFVFYIMLIVLNGRSQGEPKNDTTKVNIGKIEIIVIDKNKVSEVDKAPEDEIKKLHEAHWAGVDLGFTSLLNQSFNTDFQQHPYWNNDPARSMTWNINLLEHKFGLVKQCVGLTTGLGFSFTQIAFKNNYLLVNASDTIYADVDSINSYSKNKLRATYLTVPFLIEFSTNKDPDNSFYLAIGVVGGVRIASQIKRVGEYEGKEFRQKLKGLYGLNSFKLDGTVRMGFDDWGAFVSYNFLPLFDTYKTVDVYPLTFGLSLNF